MFKHALVLVVAVAVALGVAQQMMKLSDAHASSSPLVQAAPETVAAAAPAPVAGPAPTAAAPAPPAMSNAEASLAPGDARVVKGADGHYWAEAEVNGRPIRFLIDTGASFVALTRQDAEQLGLNPSALVYDAPVTTANGRTEAARVQLDYVAVSGARVEQVPAMVIADGLSTSLLGMSYLGRLSRFEATPTSLILRP